MQYTIPLIAHIYSAIIEYLLIFTAYDLTYVPTHKINLNNNVYNNNNK